MIISAYYAKNDSPNYKGKAQCDEVQFVFLEIQKIARKTKMSTEQVEHAFANLRRRIHLQVIIHFDVFFDYANNYIAIFISQFLT